MKIELEIPERINDIKLWQWQKYMDMVDEDSDTDFVNRKALEIFYGINNDYYNRLKVKDIEHLVNELSKALNQKPKLIRRFTLNDIEYGFIPNMDDITLGEFVDLDTYNTPKDYHKMMSVLYRPVIDRFKKQYVIEPYSGVGDNLVNMPLGVALSATAFFFDIGIQLTSVTLKSLIPTGEEQKKKYDSVLNGLGILQSIPYQMQTFTNLKKQKVC